MISNEFWRGKKVLVTGHTGFKGAWLCQWLLDIGAEVYGISLAAEDNSLYKVLEHDNKVRSFIGDIRDSSFMRATLCTIRPEIVIHMAAQALVRESYIAPLDTISTNVIGTANLLNACRGLSTIKVILNVTTDKCYENKEQVWGYREVDHLGGHDPYSSSKACSELVTFSFYNSFFKSDGVGVATARAGNVIGGGDWAKDRLIPDIFRCLMNDSTLKVRYPRAIRPWQFVLEPLGGYLKLCESLWGSPSKYSEPWNFGPHNHESREVGWVVTKIASRAEGLKYQFDNDATQRFHETTTLRLDISKSMLNLRWFPRLTTSTALEWTSDVYLACRKPEDVNRLIVEQLLAYRALLSS